MSYKSPYLSNGYMSRQYGRQDSARVPFDPAAVADCLLAHLWDDATLYTTDGGTTVAALDDPVGHQVAQAGPDGVQATSGLRPTRKADGLSLTSGCFLEFAAPVVVSGDLTIYLTGSMPSGKNWCGLTKSTGTVTGGMQRYTDGFLYVYADGGGDTLSGAYDPTANIPPDAPVLIRIRRVSGVWKLIYTGASEVDMSAAIGDPSFGDVTIDSVGLFATGSQNDSSNNLYRDRLIYSRDLEPSERMQIEDYFAARGYVLRHFGDITVGGESITCGGQTLTVA